MHADADAPPPGWLTLLAEDATAADLAAHRDRLVAAGHDRDHVQAEAARATALRDRLDAARRQTRELAVLNDLARRLASLHDPAELLPEVAAQSRQLLGVDVAYIMVAKDDGRLRIEAAEGSMGSALRGIEIAEGEGLGGIVMRTGQPLWSEDYLRDPRLVRLEQLEAAATNEQLGGILGVPLQVAGGTIGVLLVAERRRRRFADREIEVLAGLAAHAAVALRNAQLFEQRASGLEELQRTNASLRALDERRRRATELRDTLTATVLRGGSLAEVVAVIADVVGHPVLHLDADGRPTTDAGAALQPSPPPTATDFTAARTRHLPSTEGADLLATAVALRDGYAGCLVTAAPDDTGRTTQTRDETARLLEIGAASVALVIASERTVAEAELRTRGELVHALLAADVDPESVRRRARATGIDLDAIRAVAVLDPGAGDHRAAARLGERLAADLGGWSADHAGHVVVLLPRVPAATVRARVQGLGGSPLPAAVGVADCEGGTTAVRAAHEAARQTSALLVALGRDGAVAEPTELGVYRGLFSTAGRGEIAAFVAATLGELEEQDRAKDRDLVRTLDSYLGHAQHHARTCADLHVHANTLYNRLERIEAVLGPDWRDPGRVLELQLALQLRRLMRALPA
ncbi:MAG: GAF domain-containing protein [Nocardioides alkalitolerans]